MNTISNTLGERIRLLRKQTYMSQEQLALKAEMAPSFVGEIERGTKKPSIDSIEKLANALEISVSELFNYDLKTCESTSRFYENKVLVELEHCTEEEKEVLCHMLEFALKLKNLNNPNK